MLMVHDTSNDKEATTRKADVTDGRILAVERKEEENVVLVAKITKLQPMSETPA